jgi:predicted acylesterase/phospholipase RssA
VASQGYTGPLPPTAFLALSGGGDQRAFGAGLLNGWTAAGDRPQFKLVTGISTGALIAPFAFLGSAYDAKLKELYTNISARDVLKLRGYVAALTSDAMADTQPLRRLLARHVDRAMLDAIAVEYVKGRELWIATTNLDSRERYIWNLTRIAASRHPKALDAKTSRANTRRSSAAHSEALSRGDPNAAGGPSSSASGRPGITADRHAAGGASTP